MSWTTINALEWFSLPLGSVQDTFWTYFFLLLTRSSCYLHRQLSSWKAIDILCVIDFCWLLGIFAGIFSSVFFGRLMIRNAAHFPFKMYSEHSTHTHTPTNLCQMSVWLLLLILSGISCTHKRKCSRVLELVLIPTTACLNPKKTRERETESGR